MVMRKWMLYAHLNEIRNEIFYIGIGINKRPWDMIRRNKLWHKYVNKYGKPKIVIIEKDLTEREAADKELLLIKKYKRKKDGGTLTNILIEHRMNPMHDPDVKAKWLIAMNSDVAKAGRIARWKNPVIRNAILSGLHSESSKSKAREYSTSEKNKKRMSENNPMYRDENKLVISKKMKGRVFSAATKEKMSEAKKGKKQPDYLRESLLQRLESGWNPAYSKEAKAKISKALKGRKKSPEHCIKNGIVHSKPVIQFTLEGLQIRQYKSIREAAKMNNCTDALIGMCCQGKIRTAKGFKWEYLIEK